jgi:hypothetical protein
LTENSYYKDIESALKAVKFHSPLNYSWLGQKCFIVPRPMRKIYSPEIIQDYLLVHLETILYSKFYCKGYISPLSEDNFSSKGPLISNFTEALSSSNSGSGSIEPDWKLVHKNNEGWIAEKNGLKLLVKKGDFFYSRRKTFESENSINLKYPKELMNSSPGHYLALGDKKLDAKTIVRLYLNLDPRGAIRFMEMATRALNSAKLPFNIKVINDPCKFTRTDAVVLYFAKEHYSEIFRLLCYIYRTLRKYFRPRIPIFTKFIAPGLGLAEDPGKGESFGTNRCLLLAKAIIECYKLRIKPLSEKLIKVQEIFSDTGLSIGKPFMNPNSNDCYYCINYSRVWMKPKRWFSFHQYIEVAKKIGSQLCDTAIWQDNRCNWIGIVEVENQSSKYRLYHMLGPELYGGTCGIALFLAELYRITRNRRLFDTAIGAITQSFNSFVISRHKAIPPSLYNGSYGIALALAHIGKILAKDDLIHYSLEVTNKLIVRGRQEPFIADLINGKAGLIISLLGLGKMLRDKKLEERAVRVGSEIVRHAEESNGYSWRGNPEDYYNLTGVSHGTSGIAYALLELFQVTDSFKFKNSAMEAFRYERQWFDTKMSNWQDLRGSRKNSLTKKFVNFWCHGAPGIALSRMCAYEILNEEILKKEAIAGLKSTLISAKEMLNTSINDFTLCHGLAGITDVLYHGLCKLGDEWISDTEVPFLVAETGKNLYSKNNLPWPCGNLGVDFPGLLRGVAGIGYFYLRLYDPKIQSVLMLEPQKFQ